jgi:hypothetical protein
MFRCAVPRVIVHKYRFPCRVRQGFREQGNQRFDIFSRSFRVGTIMVNTVVTLRPAKLCGGAPTVRSSSNYFASNDVCCLALAVIFSIGIIQIPDGFAEISLVAILRKKMADKGVSALRSGVGKRPRANGPGGPLVTKFFRIAMRFSTSNAHRGIVSRRSCPSYQNGSQSRGSPHVGPV